MGTRILLCFLVWEVVAVTGANVVVSVEIGEGISPILHGELRKYIRVMNYSATLWRYM
jgi:hypothetical protein